MRRVHAFVPALLLLLAACDKDKPKADEQKKSEPTPVPSDLVFNDFLPTQGGNAAGLGVRDAGLEGGLAAVGAGEPTAAAGEPSAAGDKVIVTDAGGEPKAVRKYTFVANRVDKRTLTITQSVAQSMGGQTSPPQEQALKMALDLTPKTVKPGTGATLEVKLTKFDIPGAPPQAAQMLAAMSGLSGTFDVTTRGEAGEVQFVAGPQMQSQAAEPIVGGVSQAVQLLLAPFPDVPIGVGAKWELPQAREQADQGAKRFTLKELTADGAVVEADLEVKVPRRQQPAQRGQPPMTVEIDGKGHYVYQVRFDHVSSRVEGEMTVNEKIEVVDPRAGGKQQVTRIQKMKNLLETPK